MKQDAKEMLQEDLFIMGRIELEEDGLLSYNDFNRIFRIVQKHAQFRVVNELEMDAQKRIEFLEKNGLHAAQNQIYYDMALQSI